MIKFYRCRKRSKGYYSYKDMKVKKNIVLISIVLIVMIILLCSTGCCFGISNLFRKKPVETMENRESDKIAENVDTGLVDLNTDFALRIFKELSNEDKGINVFISPLSISTALAMAYNGAKNQTFEEITATLGFENYNTEDLNGSFNVLLSSMVNIDDMVELHTGNSIWFRNDIKVEKSFTDVVENYYNAAIYNADFDSADTANRINHWVSEATEGKIGNIASPDALKGTVMYLINAIYFKGQWKDKFKTENTNEEDFFLMDGNTKKVQMMQNNEKYLCYVNEDFKMVRIPYGRDKTAMYVLLPDEDINVNDFISSLSRDLLNEYIAKARDSEVMLKFPKFNVEYGSKSLVEPLKNMGMENPFVEDMADFSGIAPQLYISQIEHKALIEVNEEGTVAAAASSMGFGATAVEPVEFIVNRPFLLLIRDDRTQNILFMGKILEP